MTEKDAISYLSDITGADQEMAHGQSDEILLTFLKTNGHSALAEAYQDVNDRCGGFWYA